MANIDLLEGLKVAISKGETLQQAMQSFYNAGYNKRDIEESAKVLQSQIHQEQIQKPKLVKSENNIKKPSKLSKPQLPKTTQKISNYGQEKPFKKKIIILISLLIVIVGVILAGIFFFRENLLEFFTKILKR
jgi:proline dehydrogenase|tara:strand:+ start:2285 stop:2680 length:396 start_codon:yes stop_codon:yes gene_type:complete